jgi:diguanylate cyclase (GGDEF)-like protein
MQSRTTLRNPERSRLSNGVTRPDSLIRHDTPQWRAAAANAETTERASAGGGAGSSLRATESVTGVVPRRQREQNLSGEAESDVLTGTHTRRLFLDRVSEGIAEGRRLERTVAVFLIDLDRFKQVNDVFGYEAGNRILREAAGRIRRSLNKEDAVFHLGGDEFAVFLRGLDATSSVKEAAERIRKELNSPFPLGEDDIYVSAGIGIAVHPHDGESGEQLLKAADFAMEEAKRAGGDGVRFYSARRKGRVFHSFDMESRLRRALENDEMELHYQPQVDMATGQINSVEALLRWSNPDLGQVSPAQFIPIAEKTGLIHPIGVWVLETACAQGKAWLDAGLRPIRMCVNVSPRQLNESLVETLRKVLGKTQLHPSSIELEITENLLISRSCGAGQALRVLQTMGIGFAIDDFGTGYATFDYLKRFPVRTLKIDRSFVRGVCDDSNDRAIVAASIFLAGSLGLRVVAEGIETPDQYARLKGLGCHDCQGYHVSRPLAASTLENYLASKYQVFPTDVPPAEPQNSRANPDGSGSMRRA